MPWPTPISVPHKEKGDLSVIQPPQDPHHAQHTPHKSLPRSFGRKFHSIASSLGRSKGSNANENDTVARRRSMVPETWRLGTRSASPSKARRDTIRADLTPPSFFNMKRKRSLRDLARALSGMSDGHDTTNSETPNTANPTPVHVLLEDGGASKLSNVSPPLAAGPISREESNSNNLLTLEPELAPTPAPRQNGRSGSMARTNPKSETKPEPEPEPEPKRHSTPSASQVLRRPMHAQSGPPPPYKRKESRKGNDGSSSRLKQQIAEFVRKGKPLGDDVNDISPDRYAFEEILTPAQGEPLLTQNCGSSAHSSACLMFPTGQEASQDVRADQPDRQLQHNTSWGKEERCQQKTTDPEDSEYSSFVQWRTLESPVFPGELSNQTRCETPERTIMEVASLVNQGINGIEDEIQNIAAGSEHRAKLLPLSDHHGYSEPFQSIEEEPNDPDDDVLEDGIPTVEMIESSRESNNSSAAHSRGSEARSVHASHRSAAKSTPAPATNTSKFLDDYDPEYEALSKVFDSVAYPHTSQRARSLIQCWLGKNPSGTQRAQSEDNVVHSQSSGFNNNEAKTSPLDESIQLERIRSNIDRCAAGPLLDTFVESRVPLEYWLGIHTQQTVSRAQNKQELPCNTLYIGNLLKDASEAELKAIFVQQRGYKCLYFVRNQHGPMCFVDFEDISSATNALNTLYGYRLRDCKEGGIRPSFSKEGPLVLEPDLQDWIVWARERNQLYRRCGIEHSKAPEMSKRTDTTTAITTQHHSSYSLHAMPEDLPELRGSTLLPEKMNRLYDQYVKSLRSQVKWQRIGMTAAMMAKNYHMFSHPNRLHQSSLNDVEDPTKPLEVPERSDVSELGMVGRRRNTATSRSVATYGNDIKLAEADVPQNPRANVPLKSGQAVDSFQSTLQRLNDKQAKMDLQKSGAATIVEQPADSISIIEPGIATSDTAKLEGHRRAAQKAEGELRGRRKSRGHRISRNWRARMAFRPRKPASSNKVKEICGGDKSRESHQTIDTDTSGDATLDYRKQSCQEADVLHSFEHSGAAETVACSKEKAPEKIISSHNIGWLFDEVSCECPEVERIHRNTADIAETRVIFSRQLLCGAAALCRFGHFGSIAEAILELCLSDLHEYPETQAQYSKLCLPDVKEAAEAQAHSATLSAKRSIPSARLSPPLSTRTQNVLGRERNSGQEELTIEEASNMNTKQRPEDCLALDHGLPHDTDDLGLTSLPRSESYSQNGGQLLAHDPSIVATPEARKQTLSIRSSLPLLLDGPGLEFLEHAGEPQSSSDILLSEEFGMMRASRGRGSAGPKTAEAGHTEDFLDAQTTKTTSLKNVFGEHLQDESHPRLGCVAPNIAGGMWHVVKLRDDLTDDSKALKPCSVDHARQLFTPSKHDTQSLLSGREETPSTKTSISEHESACITGAELEETSLIGISVCALEDGPTTSSDENAEQCIDLVDFSESLVKCENRFVDTESSDEAAMPEARNFVPPNTPNTDIEDHQDPQGDVPSTCIVSDRIARVDPDDMNGKEIGPSAMIFGKRTCSIGLFPVDLKGKQASLPEMADNSQKSVGSTEAELNLMVRHKTVKELFLTAAAAEVTKVSDENLRQLPSKDIQDGGLLPLNQDNFQGSEQDHLTKHAPCRTNASDGGRFADTAEDAKVVVVGDDVRQIPATSPVKRGVGALVNIFQARGLLSPDKTKIQKSPAASQASVQLAEIRSPVPAFTFQVPPEPLRHMLSRRNERRRTSQYAAPHPERSPSRASSASTVTSFLFGEELYKTDQGEDADGDEGFSEY